MIDYNNMREKELKLFIIEFNKASQLDRSFSKSNLSEIKKNEFRKQLISSCIYLMEKIDNKTLKNNDIRKEIDKLNGIDKKNISYGQAQKVVNVSLKNYCFLTKQFDLIKELDCPLDSTTMKNSKIIHKTMLSVTKNDYENYQNEFENNFEYRVFKDIEYDENRIENFLK
jgi:hypothetical protein